MFVYVLGYDTRIVEDLQPPLLEKCLCAPLPNVVGVGSYGKKAVIPKCLRGSPVDRDRRNFHPDSIKLTCHPRYKTGISGISTQTNISIATTTDTSSRPQPLPKSIDLSL
ncbi:hypothetical protein TNCV_3672541 [Trichonephila clavipes]|nr:hypothetical protein TNCV_3672541 [Trichonephila clavipes]